MKLQLLLIATLFFARGVGQAEAENKGHESPAAQEQKTTAAKADATQPAKEAKPVEVAEDDSASEGQCLASEEIIKDLEKREKVIKEKEAQFAEKEKELEAQKLALKEEVTKLETIRAEIQGIRGRELAANEEKVNKLIETFESMSPKAAAAVIGKVDEELAVTALARLSTVKAGKILSQLDPTKSSRLSEMLAFGPGKRGKEKNANGESNQRAPAAAKQ